MKAPRAPPALFQILERVHFQIGLPWCEWHRTFHVFGLFINAFLFSRLPLLFSLSYGFISSSYGFLSPVIFLKFCLSSFQVTYDTHRSHAMYTWGWNYHSKRLVCDSVFSFTISQKIFWSKTVSKFTLNLRFPNPMPAYALISHISCINASRIISFPILSNLTTAVAFRPSSISFHLIWYINIDHTFSKFAEML